MSASEWIDIDCDGEDCDETLEFEVVRSEHKARSPSIVEARAKAREVHGWRKANGKDFCPACYTPDRHRNPPPEDES